jgi:hypothetical protein
MANGIPTMVIPKSKPKTKWVRQIQMPPIKNHKKFIRVDKHPGFPGLMRISAPKGHNANMPNLSACSPKGIPIMDMKKGMLANKYSKAIKIPPNTSHIMFPRVFINCGYKNPQRKYEFFLWG